MKRGYVILVSLSLILMVSSISFASALSFSDVVDFFERLFGISHNSVNNVPTTVQQPTAVTAQDNYAATRTLPSQYKAGSPIHVMINVTFDTHDCGGAVEEHLPAGWTATNIQGAGAGVLMKGVIRWAPIDGPYCQGKSGYAVEYDAVPPSSTSGSQTFSGIFSVDGASKDIGGESQTSS